MTTPNLARALSALPPDVAVAVPEASRFLRAKGVRHALCGGIAVSAYANPRATKGVDFLVGEDAFVFHGAIAVPPMSRVGSIAVDMVSIEPHLRAVAAELDAPQVSDDVNIVSAEVLIAMKLVARRLQDQADIVAILEAGAVDLIATRAWLAQRGFDVALYDQLAAKAKGA